MKNAELTQTSPHLDVVQSPSAVSITFLSGLLATHPMLWGRGRGTPTPTKHQTRAVFPQSQSGVLCPSLGLVENSICYINTNIYIYIPFRKDKLRLTLE